MDESNEKRGVYINEERGKQLIKYDGLEFEGRTGNINVTPTDFDGVIQLDSKDCLIFFELKLDDTDIKLGQENAYTRNVDYIIDGGHKAIFILAKHNVKNVEEPIYAKNTVVEKYYLGHKNWKYNGTDFENKTLKEVIDDYVRRIPYIKCVCNGSKCIYIGECKINILVKHENGVKYYMPTTDMLVDLLSCKRDYEKYLDFFANNQMESQGCKFLSDTSKAIIAVQEHKNT